jgi:hypothetical protein
MTDNWYYVRDGQQVGPVSRGQLITELLRSPFWQGVAVWKSGQSSWIEAGSVDELSSEMVQSQLIRLAQAHQERVVPPMRSAAKLPFGPRS